MDGFLGTSASLWSDLTLVLTLVLGAAAAFGAIRARQKQFDTHCPVMAVAAFLNWIPVLTVMIPTWLGVISSDSATSGLFAQVPVFHGILGAVTQLLMTYTVTRMYWAKQLPPQKPIWLMRATATLWMLTLAGGVFVYVVSYVV